MIADHELQPLVLDVEDISAWDRQTPRAMSRAKITRRLFPHISRLLVCQRTALLSRVQGVMLYDGKERDTPRHIAEDMMGIRLRCRQLSGKKMSHPPEVIAQAKREWLEKVS